MTTTIKRLWYTVWPTLTIVLLATALIIGLSCFPLYTCYVLLALAGMSFLSLIAFIIVHEFVERWNRYPRR